MGCSRLGGSRANGGRRRHLAAAGRGPLSWAWGDICRPAAASSSARGKQGPAHARSASPSLPPRPSGRGAPALRGRAEESAGRGRAAGGGAAAGFIHGAGSGDRRAKEESVREGRCCPRARMRSSELLSGGARCPSERSPHAGGTARFGTAPSTCSSHLPTQFVLCGFFFFFPALCNAERAACAGRLRASSWFRPQPGSAASCRWAPKTSSLHVKMGDFFFCIIHH